MATNKPCCDLLSRKKPPATKEKTPKEADATPRVNIQDFYEEHYEDILSFIMDNIHRDKRKEVHARLDFEESPKRRRIREGSQNSSTRTLFASTTKSGPDKANSGDRSYGAARVWFDELPPKSIDGYKDLKATFLAYFIQQKNYVKDPVEIHNIKQRDGETIEEFMK
ncbi:reverse transcriptase domain-containing protein [Tanacetum coccineum]|uniref:Reverse transcriptase domain-containing protein n=1 Tax=Tanacetum coccineum TaxID=301880 RepID=A0ABQ5C3X6_9ASTR